MHTVIPDRYVVGWLDKVVGTMKARLERPCW
jgi:hypothetical protein